ncbi:MAG: hypothetical protein CMH55_04925 [Myxococcales bacterium]|nr:hypothetical protein [Myxococcales bacterium]
MMIDDELAELETMHEFGALSDAEYAEAKAALLARGEATSAPAESAASSPVEAGPAGEAPTEGIEAQLAELETMHEFGALSDDEFAAAKASLTQPPAAAESPAPVPDPTPEVEGPVVGDEPPQTEPPEPTVASLPEPEAGEPAAAPDDSVAADEAPPAKAQPEPAAPAAEPVPASAPLQEAGSGLEEGLEHVEEVAAGAAKTLGLGIIFAAIIGMILLAGTIIHIVMPQWEAQILAYFTGQGGEAQQAIHSVPSEPAGAAEPKVEAVPEVAEAEPEVEEEPPPPLFQAIRPIAPEQVGTKGQRIQSFQLDAACALDDEDDLAGAAGGSKAERADACWLRGYRYAMGIDSLPSMQMARLHYDKACDLGHGFSCVLVARYLGLGTAHLAKDPEESKRRLEAACQQDIPEACYFLAGRKGLPATYERLQQTFAKRCAESSDYGFACLVAAKVIRRRWGNEEAVPEEAMREHLRLLWESCRLGQGSACRNLAGKTAKQTLPEPVPFGLTEAQLLRLGCAYGSSASCGAILKAGIVDSSPDFQRRGCLLGNDALCAKVLGKRKAKTTIAVMIREGEEGVTPLWVDRKETSIARAHYHLKSYQGTERPKSELKDLDAQRRPATLLPHEAKAICEAREGRLLRATEWQDLRQQASWLAVTTPASDAVGRTCMANDLVFGLCDFFSNHPEWVMEEASSRPVLAGWHPSEDVAAALGATKPDVAGELAVAARGGSGASTLDMGPGLRSYERYCVDRASPEDGDCSESSLAQMNDCVRSADGDACSDADVDRMIWAESGARCAYLFGAVAPAPGIDDVLTGLSAGPVAIGGPPSDIRTSHPSPIPGWILSLGVREEKAEAIQLAQSWRDKGIEAVNVLWMGDFQSLRRKQFWLIYKGPYADPSTARTALEQVRSVFPQAYGLLLSKTAERTPLD